MQLIRGLHNLRAEHRGCVVTVGAFDGVHKGHQWVIQYLKEQAQRLQLPSTVVLFEPLPKEYFQPLEAPARIMNFREKVEALGDCGVQRILRVNFNASVQQMTADSFIQTVFYEGLGARFVVLGDDFRFGNDRTGDIELMRRRGKQYGFECDSTPTCEYEDGRISSTRIRAALSEGNFTEAEHLLGRPFSLSGHVIYGKQLGRELGFPTANIKLARLRAPVNGVFAVLVSGGGLEHAAAIANVGVRPTVHESITANLEVHLIDRSINLYGTRIKVTFLHKIRDEIKFNDLDQLRTRVLSDIGATRRWFHDNPQ